MMTASARRRAMRLAALLTASLSVVPGSAGQQAPRTRTAPQTQTDSYTRYELLAPGSGAFHIVYDVSATTPGARFYYNTIRVGAEVEVHGVTDLYTGQSLEWEVVEGRRIKVTLARPVPKDGQGRLRIDKTYIDHDSYFQEGEDIVFSRSLGIRRNAVVLPPGYELVGCNYECQVAREEDGRIRASFMSPGPDAVPFEVRGRPLASRDEWAPPRTPPSTEAGGTGVQSNGTGARIGWTFPQRAFQDRDITYFLQQPETHSFRLFHDYTESRPGVDRYLNVVRPGSAASDPEAFVLDTGERLEIATLRGEEITRRGIDLGEPSTPESEVVVIAFDPVEDGHSVRLRIWETYTDPGRYVLAGNEFVWDRSFGRSRNTLVLPEGWYLTASAIPGVIDETADGRIRIRFVNPRPDQIRVFVTGRRR